MPFDLILQNISRHIQLTGTERDFFISILEEHSLVRKQYLLQAGEICRHTAFVTSGCLIGFTVDKKGSHHVLNFAPPNWWSGDIYSYTTQKPGAINIQAVEDTDVIMIGRENMEKLYIEVPKFERFFRIITQNSLVAHQQRLIHNLSLTAEERYLEFLKKYPSMVECVPQHAIASYLGITPEFLSRIRARRRKV